MEIGASLARLELYASDPQVLAAFYATTFGLEVTESAEGLTCSAPGRQLLIRPGNGGQLRQASFRFATAEAFEAHRETLAARGIQTTTQGSDHYAVQDPEGRSIAFLAPAVDRPSIGNDAALSARLQHFAVCTPKPAPLVDFYVDQLGFVVSDRVLDAEGDLTAAFLRTDAEHHVLAIFRAPMIRFDHFSCEAPDWPHLRDWADHMAKVGVDLAWGIGRHGPGNDTFLMVRDIDGNMGEISCDLEQCEAGRPTGVWPHRPQTLNQWGVAILRS